VSRRAPAPVPRRVFALDHNFPEPLVQAVAPYLESFIELVPIRAIDGAWSTLADWEVLWAMHRHERNWDGLITADHRMKSARGVGGLPRHNRRATRGSQFSPDEPTRVYADVANMGEHETGRASRDSTSVAPRRAIRSR
jgi:hypothetical protein